MKISQTYTQVLAFQLLLQVSGQVIQASNDTKTPTCGDWVAATRKAGVFVSQLTLEEKLRFVRGNATAGGCIGNVEAVDRLSFQGLCFADGPLSVNRNGLVSVFPAGVTVAATWDRDMMYNRGLALGAEFRGKGAHVALGPVASPLGRHAYGGRNWEGFSPDPYLTGVAMAATINGMQERGVQACSKHFIGNEQETQRSNTTLADGTPVDAISSNIDDQTLHELYLWPFADAVRAGTGAVMCSYNRLNGVYSCENQELLEKYLRTELGFQGYVVSDWFASHSTAQSVDARLDLKMPSDLGKGAAMNPGSSSFYGGLLEAAVRNGSIPTSELDKMIRRIITPYYLLGQDSPDFPILDPSMAFLLSVNHPWADIQPRDVRQNHVSLIREIGVAATVLLKNTNNTLPLRAQKNIGVFGSAAADFLNGPMYWQNLVEPRIGAIPIGGGSGSARFADIVAPIEALKAKARSTGAQIQYLLNNTAISLNQISFYPTPEVCLVVLSSFAAESYDRDALVANHNSTVVVHNVADICNNTVVILYGPGPIVMPWADHPNVKAILMAHYPGDQMGNSIVDILWGDADPAGRLPYTIPKAEDDPLIIPIVSSSGGVGPGSWQSNFVEGQLIDYRAYDARNVTPHFEFGFGLSYADFKLSAMSIRPKFSTLSRLPDFSRGIQPGGYIDLWTEVMAVEVTLSNVGKVRGHGIPQLYVSFPQVQGHQTPVRVLRGFDKVRLDAGTQHAVRFSLRRRDLSYWDTHAQNWVIPDGSFTFSAGLSSRDLQTSANVLVLKSHAA